ncbi:hypothetical protein [Aromatoleum petrolei]|uniref:Secreted protein n=1 Tax=Aromatoleum petrolei TaxID=76116 RepID=A0ABX1MT82_9RHOO|nr:hypothetical protein [Aromatoleum petrolei]NMF89881.1 hypothetical protein [Aromatoleum petrolei]QTQ34484.1 Uncharacterized protein ToN1_03060 [Aromatoleum petrolei]
MNAKSLLAAAVLSALTALSFSVRAVGDPESTENKVPASAEVKHTLVKKPGLHSHLDEKVGPASKASENAGEKPAAVPNKSKHNHQRESN